MPAAPRLSLVLLTASFVLSAVMMQPGFAGLFALAVNLGLLAGLRHAARAEGRRASRIAAQPASLRS